MTAEYLFTNETTGEDNIRTATISALDAFTNLELFSLFNKVCSANKWSNKDEIYAYPSRQGEPIFAMIQGRIEEFY